MYTCLVSVFLPRVEVFLHIDFPDSVERCNVKIAHGFIVLRRIAGGHNEEPFRQMVCSERLVLQKLQHRRRERLRDAVDLVQKQDAFLHAALLDLVIHGSNDLAHCVFGHLIRAAAVAFVSNKRQTDRALPRMMRDRISDQIDPAFLRDLFHDCCFADTGRSDQKNRALPLGRNLICSRFIPLRVGAYSVDDFLLCLFNIHRLSSYIQLQRPGRHFCVIQLFVFPENERGVIVRLFLRINAEAVGKI